MFTEILLIAHLSIKELNKWIYFNGFIISMKMLVMENWLDRSLTLSWRSSLSYRNQTIDLFCKLIDWFLYDKDVRHEIAHSTLIVNSHHSWKRDYCKTWFPPDCWFLLSSSSIIRDKLTCVLPKLAGVLSSTKFWERILFAANSAN